MRRMNETRREQEPQEDLAKRLSQAIPGLLPFVPPHSTHDMVPGLIPEDAQAIVDELERSGLDTESFVTELERRYHARPPEGKMNYPWYHHVQPVLHLVATSQFLDALHQGMTINEFSETGDRFTRTGPFAARFRFQANNLVTVLSILDRDGDDALPDGVGPLARQVQQLRQSYEAACVMSQPHNLPIYFPAETIEESQHQAREHELKTGLAYLEPRLQLERRYLRYLFTQERTGT